MSAVLTPAAAVPLSIAVRALADRPGGARAVPGISPADAALTERLARIDEASWAPGARRACWELLRRHRGTLLEHDIDFGCVPLPPDAAPVTEIRCVFERAGAFVVAFTYDPDVHDLANALPERRFDRVNKEYVLPPTRSNALALCQFLRAAGGFSVSAAAAELLQDLLSTTTSTARPARIRMTHTGTQWQIVMPAPASNTEWRALSIVQQLPDVHATTTPDQNDLTTYTSAATDTDTLGRLAQLAALDIVAITAEDRGRLPQSPPAGAPDTRRLVLESSGRARITFPYDPVLVGEIKQIAGASWDGADRAWVLPVDAHRAATVLRFAKAAGLHVSEPARVQLETLADTHAKIRARRRDDAEAALAAQPALSPDRVPLMGFQREGVAEILALRHALLADEQGLGKSVQGLSAVVAADAFPAVIVAPAGLKLNWKAETQRWFPHLAVTVLSGTKPDSSKLTGDLLILNYDIASAWAPALCGLRIGALLVDESHYLKNRDSQRTKAVRAIAGAVRPGGLRLLMSGTPMINAPYELIPQLQVLDRIKNLGGVKHFQVRYCDLRFHHGRWDETGSANEAELHERLEEHVMIRRLKADVLDDLPDKLPPAPIVVELSNRAAYRRVTKDVVARLLADQARAAELERAAADGRTSAQAHHDAATAAQRAANAAALVLLNKLRQAASAGKLKAGIEWITNFLAGGRKLIVFADFHDTQRALIDAFDGCATILGGQTDTEAHKARFMNDEDCRLIICSLKAAQAGHTLTAASDVLFVDLPWTPKDVAQATDRAHRIGQLHPVTPWFLVAADTIDTDMSATLALKAGRVAAVIDGDTTGPSGSVMSTVLTRLLA